MDYGIIGGADEPIASPEPTVSSDMMVAMSTYEALEDKYNELEETIADLQDQLKNAEQKHSDEVGKNLMIEEALDQIELEIYRSVISKGELEVYFGGVRSAGQKEDGGILAEVSVLEQSNEKFDSSLYAREAIEGINEDLTFEYSEEKTRSVTIGPDTVVRYNGESYPALDSGFYPYLADQLLQAKVATVAEDAEEDMIY